jgi:hypothetical protein
MSLRVRVSIRQHYRRVRVLPLKVRKRKGMNRQVRTPREITANSGEVERRNREDESFERAVLNAASVGVRVRSVRANNENNGSLPCTPGIPRRLLRVKFLDVLHPEAEKVDKLKKSEKRKKKKDISVLPCPLVVVLVY